MAVTANYVFTICVIILAYISDTGRVYTRCRYLIRVIKLTENLLAYEEHRIPCIYINIE